MPVETPFDEKATDWWISRAGNDIYDEVHFSREWKIYHYYLPDAKEGPCEVSPSLPSQGRIPWVQPGTEVMKASTSERKVLFGSFIAIQRAGGTYAMASGSRWRRHAEPYNDAAGTTANVKNERYDWMIDTNGQLPKASVLYEGRGEFKVFSGGRVRRLNLIYLYDEKDIYIPEDRELKLGILQGHDCAKTCLGSSTFSLYILDYNIENGGSKESEKGKLDATVSVFLSPLVANPDGGANRNLRDRASGHGVFLDGSYTLTSERKAKTVDGLVYGPLKAEPTTAYHLQYLIEFDLSTEGPGAAATHWMYRGKITPSWVFLAK